MSKDDRFLTIASCMYAVISAGYTTVLAILTVMILTDVPDTKKICGGASGTLEIIAGCVGALATLYAACATLLAISNVIPRNRKSSVRRSGKKRRHHTKSNNIKLVDSSIATAEAGYGAVKRATEAMKAYFGGLCCIKK